MSDKLPLDDDDSPLSNAPATPARNASVSLEEDDEQEDLLDYSQLAKLTSKNNTGLIPKRGEKDFERHGTKHQDNILENSREAMHDALAYPRVHVGRGSVRGYYVGSEGADDQTYGMGGDYCVAVGDVKGPHFKTMGKMKGESKKGGGSARTLLWLLPEEALYLVERGSMDLWWANDKGLDRILRRTGEEMEIIEEQEDELGIPMSLQAAYALLVGRNGERGKVELDRYTVFANLRRTGYVVLRAPEWDATKPGATPHHALLRQEAHDASPQTLFTWLWSKIFSVDSTHSKPMPYGPLVRPGLYRSYNSIYKQLSVIPRHKSAATPNDPGPPPEAPYRVIFHLWKPARIPTFAKSNPGTPDFRIAVVNARTTSVPTLTQVTSLLESTPFDPPSGPMVGRGARNLYTRVRKGYRSVVVAVVDEGLISYLRFGEGAFGAEPLFEEFDGGSRTNAKGGRGGGRGGRGGGRGGRGRGRGA